MTTTPIRADVKAQIVKLVRAERLTRQDGTPVQVMQGRDDRKIEDEVIHLGEVRGDAAPANISGGARQQFNDQFTVEVWIIVRRPGLSIEDSDTRCQELASAVWNVLATTKALGDEGLQSTFPGVLWAMPRDFDGPSFAELPRGEGWASLMRLLVEVKTRTT